MYVIKWWMYKDITLVVNVRYLNIVFKLMQKSNILFYFFIVVYMYLLYFDLYVGICVFVVKYYILLVEEKVDLFNIDFENKIIKQEID